MKLLYEIIQQIASTSSTNEKLEIMRKHKENAALRTAFYYAYHPQINFYVKLSETTVESIGEQMYCRELDETFINLLQNLSNRVYTGNEARSHVNDLLFELCKGDQKVFAGIINKDLRCGASGTLANKVWPNLVPEYPVMLCGKFDSKSKKFLEKFEGNVGFIVQRKSDGGRLNIIVDEEGNVSYHSRNGSELNLYGYFDDLFKQYKGFVFDGELLARGENGIVERKISNGLYTKAVRGTLSKDEVRTMCFDVWDMIDITEFKLGFGEERYEDRLTRLLNTVASINPGIVRVVESLKVDTLDECEKFYNRMRAEGEEGAIIKVANSIWEDKRSKSAVKLKAEETGDFLCTGYEEGTGKYAGMIGALKIETSDGLLKCNVGTGLDDDDRKRDPSYFVSKIVEVAYNEVISSKGKNTKSLFLPVYKQVRFDKNTANSLSELK